MYRTKKDVDKHVTNILNRIKNENERNLRGFTIAKLYSLVGDYETAKRYLAGFLSLREKDAAGHKLLAQIHERMGYSDKAIQSYKKSLELEENQKDIVLKICELYCHLPVDPERARYWADRAEKLFPHNDIVFKLRECIVSADGEQNTQELENLITAELASRPKDANLRIKLLKLYLDTERSKEAYKHVLEVESRRPYSSNINWYYCMTEVLETYLDDMGKEYTMELLMNLLLAYDRLVYLSLEEHQQPNQSSRKMAHSSNLLDSASALQSFDQILFKAHNFEEKDTSWENFLRHMDGQLYFHMGTFLLKRSKKEHGSGNMKEASSMSVALFLLAYSFRPLDKHSSWYCRAAEKKQKELDYLYNQACFRLSQSGHIILGVCRENCSKWLQKIRLQVFTAHSREKIFQRIFSSQVATTSYFMTMSEFLDFVAEFPDGKALQEYDKVTHFLYPESLHHHVWLALQYYSLKQKIQPDYDFQLFQGLQYSCNNLTSPTVESLCFLDVQAFLYATVRTMALTLEERHSVCYSAHDNPLVLPVSISPHMCTEEQAEWWSAAYKLFANTAVEHLGDLRRILQHGIEVIRVIGNHGLDVRLIIHLAETFADRASEMKLQSDNNTWLVLEKRAAHYWKAAVNLLEKLSNNQTIRMPTRRLFSGQAPDPSAKEVKKWLEEGRFFLACQAMNINKHEEAIQIFDTLKSPYASYYQAVIFKKLAEEECNQPREQITSEMRSKHIILLTRARDALYATLDRLHGDHKHPLNQVLPNEVEDIETKLARIDPDTSQRHDFDALSDECLSSQESDERNHTPDSPHQHYLSRQTFRKSSGFSHSCNVMHSTPHTNVPYMSSGRESTEIPTTRHQEEHTRPSPERLDAQMRSLAYSHDAVIKTIMEQNKALIDSHHSIVQALQQNKSAVEQVKIQLEEIQKHIFSNLMARRRFRRKLVNQRGGQPMPRQRGPANAERSAKEGGGDDEQGNNEDYYDGYFYDEEADYEETEDHDKLYHDIQLNPAYKYQEHQLPSEYPYGHITGLHGTSTVTYAPPSGSRNLNHPQSPHAFSGYAAYYHPPPPQIMTVNPSVPTPGLSVHGRPIHPQSLGAGYFGPPGPPGPPSSALSASLPFSEGQKLPEFNFSPGVRPTGAPCPAGAYISNKASAYPHIGQPTSMMPSENLIVPPLVYPDPLVPGVAAVSPSSAATLNNAVLVTTVTSAPHAFQIPMPSPVAAGSPSGSYLPNKDASTSLESNTEAMALAAPQISIFPIENGSLHPHPSRKPIEQGKIIISTPRNDYYKEEEDYAGPDFKPLIPLPDEVEVKTGEEDEVILFEERAKLFRFADKEWKERGIGFVKILWHEKTSRVRLLMRRDQVLKICANHYIQSDMKLVSVKNLDTAWIWAAQDFADEEMRTERFCIRFKTAEAALSFKQEFSKAQAIAAKSEKLIASCPKPRPELEFKSLEKEGFGEKFRAKPGSWNCRTCLINNDSGNVACIACGEENPNSDARIAATTPAKPTFGFQFGAISTPAGTNSVFSTMMSNHSGNNSAYQMKASNSATENGSQTKLMTSDSSTLDSSLFNQVKDSLSNKDQMLDIEKKNDADLAKPPTDVKFSFSFPNAPSETSDKGDHQFAFPQSSFVFGNKSSSSVAKPTGFIFGASTVEKVEPTSKESPPSKTSSNILQSKSSPVVVPSDNREPKQADLTLTPSPSTYNYGGFTFTTLPTIRQSTDSPEASKETLKPMGPKAKERDETPTKRDYESKPSPFASFSFRSSKFGSSGKDDGSPTLNLGNNVFGSKSAVDEKLTFSTLASTPTGAGFKSDPHFIGFSGMGDTVFKPRSKNDSASSNPSEEYESSAEFRPIVPLPELVDTKTGEEEEEKLFGERGKLFRFDAQTNQWKERGIGEIKLLKHRISNKCRVLMRREQVLKLCANHNINPDMELKPLQTSNNAWMWSASDYSEGELKPETLAIKFKHPEQASNFRDIFVKCIADSKLLTSTSDEPSSELGKGRANAAPLSELFQPEKGSWECPTCSIRNKSETMLCIVCGSTKSGTSEIKQAPLSELFKPKEGSWECTTCFVRNMSDVTHCAACSTIRPGTSEVKQQTSLSELFKPKEGSWECTTCCVRNKSEATLCVACSSTKPGASEVKQPPLSELFKPKEGSWECPACCVRNGGEKEKCEACESSKPVVGQAAPSRMKPQFPFKESSTPFKFGVSSTNNSGAFQFGTVPPVSAPVKTSPISIAATNSVENVAANFTSDPEDEEGSPVSALEFRFGSPQKFTFSFSGVRPKSPAKTPKSPRLSDTSKDQSIGEEADSSIESEGDHIFFQPIIPLPDKVDVKTGEEDEDTLYIHRAKLFRLVDSEWKERGLGDIKILQNRLTKKIRLLMRRDQVLKICLNHFLTPDLKFLPKDEKSWIWATTDFSENEAREERFAIRFKNQEISSQFMQAITEAKDSLENVEKQAEPAASTGQPLPQVTSSSSNKVESSSTVNTKTPSTAENFSFKMENLSATPSSFTFGNKFGASSDSGPGSLFGGITASAKKDSTKKESLINENEGKIKTTSADKDEDEPDVVYEKRPSKDKIVKAQSLSLPPSFYLYEEAPNCPGCRGCDDNDGDNKEVEIIRMEVASPEKIALALKYQLPPNFYLYENKPPCPGCRGCRDEIPDNLGDSPAKISEPLNSSQQKEKEDQIVLSEVVSKTELDFASLARNIVPEFTQASPSGFAFAGTGAKVFNASLNDSCEDEVPPMPDPHFAPIVPLPNLIEVKTGEEDEEKVYGQRAKLYRFDTTKQEWKERGIGEAKILKHKETNRFRLLLRREQVYKIACNHYLTPDMHLVPLVTSETAWCWSAMDFAEETSKLEKFAIKFKTVQLAQDFKKKFEECQMLLATSTLHDAVNNITIASSSNEKSILTKKDPPEVPNNTNENSSPPMISNDETHVKASSKRVSLVIPSASTEETSSQNNDTEDDDDEESVMFEKRVTLAYFVDAHNKYEVAGIGNLRVLYDDDMYGARIQVVTDEGNLVCNHLIAVQMNLLVQGAQCFWSATDYSHDEPKRIQFKANFSSAAAAKEFNIIFSEGKDYAKHSDIWERPIDALGIHEDLSDNGTGGQ